MYLVVLDCVEKKNILLLKYTKRRHFGFSSQCTVNPDPRYTLRYTYMWARHRMELLSMWSMTLVLKDLIF